jgi:uncharacterized protein with ParB-like and HNH nuclease domain
VGLSKHFIFTEQRIIKLTLIKGYFVGKAVKKSSEETLNQALDKLVMVCPNKKTYDELTSLMFQLYCGNDFGLGNFSLSFLDKIENRWRSGRKAAAKAKGISLVVKNV